MNNLLSKFRIHWPGKEVSHRTSDRLNICNSDSSLQFFQTFSLFIHQYLVARFLLINSKGFDLLGDQSVHAIDKLLFRERFSQNLLIVIIYVAVFSFSTNIHSQRKQSLCDLVSKYILYFVIMSKQIRNRVFNLTTYKLQWGTEICQLKPLLKLSRVQSTGWSENSTELDCFLVRKVF